MQNLDLMNYNLSFLRSEGFFVTILSKEEDYIVECRIYITDHDEETGTINILEVPKDQLVDDNEKCLACKTSPGEVRIMARGCISCPLLCGSFTRPFALTEKVYRAKLNNLSVLPPQMVSIISAALKRETP